MSIQAGALVRVGSKELVVFSVEDGLATLEDGTVLPLASCTLVEEDAPALVPNLASRLKAAMAAKPPTVATPALSFSKAWIETPTVPPPHLIVRARAGTGKTFTIVVGVVWIYRHRVPGLWQALIQKLGFEPEPSPQQLAVWESMELSASANTVQFTAFNKSIVRDFEQKWGWVIELLKQHGITFQFSTMHSMGNKAVYRAFGKLALNEYKTQDITAELLGINVRELHRTKPVVLNATQELVGLCKLNLTADPDAVELDGYAKALRTLSDEHLDALARHHDVDLTDDSKGRGRGLDRSQEIFSLVPQVLKGCLDPKRTGSIDYNDMIWLPVALELPIFRHDLLLVDEAQDLGRAQQELARRAGKRLIFVGDDRQAIYGFCGADTESLPRLERNLKTEPRSCLVLPLTVTRRCGKRIVEEAQQIVPDFAAHPQNPEGLVRQALYPVTRENQPVPDTQNYTSEVRDGDFVLCRVNAPLVTQCFRFLRQGRKATIQGRDVGKGLVSTVNKLASPEGDNLPVNTLISRLGDWLQIEMSKEQAKRNPSESRLINLQDRHDCLLCFTADAAVVADVVRRIEQVFTDNKNAPGVKFSSIHRAKGLESKRVFFLMPKGGECPHPMAKSAWQRVQEENCRYVGITRAIHELIYVV